MARYRTALPQSSERLFLTDGGLETTLIFHDGLELPDFAAFALHRDAEGEARLRAYYARYTSIARRHGAGFVFESATWRASADWAVRLGYTPEQLAEANARAIAFLEPLREQFERETGLPGVISGCVGPRGDGYEPTRRMSESEAERYHGPQVRVFAESAADMVAAITMNYVEEAVGITRAAAAAGMPVAVSFTVETDGRLPTGQPLSEAVRQVDAATGGAPAYFMINCAHPTHFADVVGAGGAWLQRVSGLRANASSLSHAELNDSPTLDAGDPAEFGRQHAALWGRLPRLRVLGGCCGTDHRHIEQLALACMPLQATRPPA